MSRVIGKEACPECRKKGQDRSGNNRILYADGGHHCFACGDHRPGKFQLRFINKEEYKDEQVKAVLPSDFTREVPAEGWRWILQYGLPYSYWKTYCGYSPGTNRLVITYGEPPRLSQGRALSVGDSKWTTWGERRWAGPIGENLSEEIVLVEDLVSAHKVGQLYTSIPLLGTDLSDIVIKELQKQKRPVVLWQDGDQYRNLPKRVGRLQTLLATPVRYISTRKDPKGYKLEEIKEILG